MKYTYTEIDLLKSPQKYQQSQFHGKEFLLAFRHSRENIQNSISKRIPINTYPDLVTNPYVHISLDEKVNFFDIKNSMYNTEEFLKYFITNCEHHTQSKFIEKLLKSFEVNKKIFSDYNSNTLVHSENFSIMLNYALFSLSCAKIFCDTHNLKFLNTLLKLNDILCSRINLIDDHITLFYIYHAIDFELRFVNDLLDKKEINL